MNADRRRPRAPPATRGALSSGIPSAPIPPVVLCRDRRLTGGLVNRRATTAVVTVVAGPIVVLNAVLLVRTLG